MGAIVNHVETAVILQLAAIVARYLALLQDLACAVHVWCLCQLSRGMLYTCCAMQYLCGS